MMEEDNTWSVVFYPWGTDSYGTSQISVGGSTTINNVEYKQVFTDDNQTSCLVREENGIVYYLNEANQNGGERIMYDFSLEVGDTFDNEFQIECVGYGTFVYQPYVSNIEFQEIGGQERKIIEFTEFENSDFIVETWIEGIGSLSGFDPFGMTFDNDIDLACFNDGETVTMFNGNDECSFFIMSVDEFLLSQINITPNPVTEIATLTIPQEIQSANITVYDVNGKKLMQQDISEMNTTIDFSSLTSGMYFYSIYSENKLILTKKLLVE